MTNQIVSAKEDLFRLPGANPKFAWSVFVAALFAFYGPSFNFAGQLRYVEGLLLALGALNFNAIVSSLGKWEKRFVALFFLTAIAQIFSDQISNSDSSGTIKRAGTYVLLALLIPILNWLGKNNWLRIRWILVGYCASYVTLFFIGHGINDNYSNIPWRLGLGYAATLALCVAIAWRPRLLLVGSLALAVLAAVHLFWGSRSLSVIVIVVAGLAFLSCYRKSFRPLKIDPVRMCFAIGIGLLAALAIYKFAEYSTQKRWYPNELQSKMEEQFSNPYGLIAAARPDTAAALFAIQKRPLTGHGSTNVDPEVWKFYTEMNTASYVWSSGYDALYERRLNQEWSLGTPSHSHLFGAWADAGVLGALSWLVLLAVSTYAGSTAALWKSRFAPLITFIAFSNIWDIFFSPGPHRMDVAIRLMILLFALAQFKMYDAQFFASGARTLRR